MTDNARGYCTSQAFADALTALSAGHRLIHPYWPQTKGKIKRVYHALVDEWAYTRTYKSNLDR